jgi:signal transduction histidine kinase
MDNGDRTPRGASDVRRSPPSMGVRLAVTAALVAVVGLLVVLAMIASHRPALAVAGGVCVAALSWAGTVLVVDRRRALAAAADGNTLRARIADARLDERLRLTRNLHDGVQNPLYVALVAVEKAKESSAPEGAETLGLAIGQIEQALNLIRDFASDVYPAVLDEMGLLPAIESLVDRLPLLVEVSVPHRRFRQRIEYGVYFLVSETLTNVLKHADTRRATVTARVVGDMLDVDVSDDGVGGANPDGGGLTGLRQRIDALNGVLTIDSRPGQGTRIRAVIPCG